MLHVEVRQSALGGQIASILRDLLLASLPVEMPELSSMDFDQEYEERKLNPR